MTRNRQLETGTSSSRTGLLRSHPSPVIDRIARLRKIERRRSWISAQVSWQPTSSDRIDHEEIFGSFAGTTHNIIPSQSHPVLLTSRFKITGSLASFLTSILTRPRSIFILISEEASFPKETPGEG